jgi:hypothetical protein
MGILMDIKQKLKSDTHKWNLLMGVVGIVEINMGLLKGVLGEYYGAVFIVVAVIGYLLREKTTMPVEMK